MRTKELLSRIFIPTILLCLVSAPANAQLGKLKNLVKNKLEKKTEKKVEKVSSKDSGFDAKPTGKFHRSAPTPGDYDPETFLSSDITPCEHSDWNKETPTGRLKEHLGFLVSKQIEYLNNGDWDNVGKDFQVHSKPMWLVCKELRSRGENTAWTEKRLGDLRQIQRQHLYPGIKVYDRNGYTDKYQTGDYDWRHAKITKKEFYEILFYYIEMAKKEKSETMRYVSTSQAIFWRGDGAMNPSSFKEVPIYGDDSEWIEADKELSELCKASGISALTTFEQIEDYRKKLELEALKDDMAKNTSMIPAKSLNDPQAVRFATESFNQVMQGRAIVEKVFVRTGWEETTNKIGVTISRAKYLTIIAKYQDGIYRLHNCRLVSTTSNNGKSWSNSMFSIDAVSGNREGYPINWKK